MKDFLLASILMPLHRVCMRRGQTLVEYALIIMFIGSVLFVLLAAFGEPLARIFGKITQTLTAASH